MRWATRFRCDAHGAARRDHPGITGATVELPRNPERNTAGRAVLAMQQALDLPFGFDMRIEKGIPLGSGLGGSAASAVAAVVAANALLPQPCSKLELLKFAMHGEAVASGSHARGQHRPVAVRRAGAHRRHRQSARQADSGAARVCAVMVHPHLFLSTKEARAILQAQGRDVGLRVADRESGRVHFRLLHE